MSDTKRAKSDGPMVADPEKAGATEQTGGSGTGMPFHVRSGQGSLWFRSERTWPRIACSVETTFPAKGKRNAGGCARRSCELAGSCPDFTPGVHR